MSNAVIPKYVTWDGHFNHAPSPMVEISEQDFWKQFSAFGIGYAQEFLQVESLPDVKEGWLKSIKIFWYNDHGIAIYTPWDGTKYNPRFFKIGCKHEYEATNESRRCYHVSVCKLCGTKQAIDSSD